MSALIKPSTLPGLALGSSAGCRTVTAGSVALQFNLVRGSWVTTLPAAIE